MRIPRVLFAATLTACAARSPALVSGTPPPGADAPDELPAHFSETSTTPTSDRAHSRPDEPTLVAGHRDARYELVVPPGFGRRLRVQAEGADPRELSDAGADGIGLLSDPAGLNSIVLFSDPLGLGFDVRAAGPGERARVAALYGDFIRQRFPSASTANEVSVGPHRALRFELSNVVLSGRAPRRGRHYLVLDGLVTVSVDCLWTDEHADRVSAACDAVAASLRRQ